MKETYNYDIEKQRIFTEDGQKKFLEIRDNIKELLTRAGAVMLYKAIQVKLDEEWFGIACVERLVELGEIIEISQINTMTQYRVYISA